MGLTTAQITQIEENLKSIIRKKLHHFIPEPTALPIYTWLLGQDRLALYQFIHSPRTNLETAVFEPIACIAAQEKFDLVEENVNVGNQISQLAQAEIKKIMDEIVVAGSKPNKPNEIERIRNVAQDGKMVNVKPTKVDLKLESSDGIFLFDIKTAEPNEAGIKKLKRTLLEWAAITFAHNPNAKLHTLAAIPYNPYAPQQYHLWMIGCMLDSVHEIIIAEKF